jgi:hypothetical protein
LRAEKSLDFGRSISVIFLTVGVNNLKDMRALSLLLALLASVPVLAHHNYRLRFDYDIDVTMTGVVTNFDWKNPHIEIFIDIENEDGSVTGWVMPTAAPSVANRLGITPETVLPGDRLIITGALARNGTNELRARTMTLEDGTYYILSPQGYRNTDQQGGMGMGMGS